MNSHEDDVTYSKLLARRREHYKENSKASEYLVPAVYISRQISIAFSYLFIRLRLKPDTITFFSFVIIGLSFFSFIKGSLASGVLFMFSAQIFDCVDGDMARFYGPSKHGGILDSIGTDIFFSLIPFSICFFIAYNGEYVGRFSEENLVLLGALSSISYILLRATRVKLQQMVDFYVTGSKDGRPGMVEESSPSTRSSRDTITKIISIYRSELFRQNFVAEPGFIFNLSVLLLLQHYEWVALYLLCITIYNTLYFGLTFVLKYRVIRKLVFKATG